MQVNMHEAKSQLSALGKKAWEGERIVIARAGEPYLDLLPHKEQRKSRRPGRFKGKIRMSDDFMETPAEIINSFYEKD
jgi:antitoxin (DNA-binding transcriptional repressor) of toxin-antitoxin stability system